MTDAIIDQETWKTMKATAKPDFLVDLLNVYLCDSPLLIEEMRSGLAKGNIAGVLRAANSLKSNSASLGARRLASAAHDMEILAQKGTLEGAFVKLATLEMEYARVTNQLLELKNGL